MGGHIHAGRGREELAYDGAQAAYDAVVAGERDLWAVVVLAALLLGRWLRERVFLRLSGGGLRRRGEIGGASTTTLVNASMVTGPRNEVAREAIVVRL